MSGDCLIPIMTDDEGEEDMAIEEEADEEAFDSMQDDEERKRVGTYLIPDQFDNIRFLIVDDEPFNLMALEGLLQLQGYNNIEKCFNGQEAIDLLEEKGYDYYDIVMTDCQMPLVDGLQLAQQIRFKTIDSTKVIQIVLVTGDAFQAHQIGKEQP